MNHLITDLIDTQGTTPEYLKPARHKIAEVSTHPSLPGNTRVDAPTPLSKEIIRVVILDNQTLIRAGLHLLIESQADLKVVGQAGNLSDGLNLIASTQPDIVLLEYDPPSGFGFDGFPDIHKAWAKARMILVTGSNDRLIYLQAVQHEVMGVVSKTQAPEVLIKAIRKVHVGEVWIEHSMIANLIAHSFHQQPATGINHEVECIALLSEREREVIKYIGCGLKNKAIACQMCIEETTVRHHMTSIFSKLGVSDRLELLIFAIKHGLATVPDIHNSVES